MVTSKVIHQIYNAFNARDMQGVFALLTDDVAWANGMEGTHIHGKDAIRDYWTHQWSVIDPHVEPLKIARAADGFLVVDVHQVVKSIPPRRRSRAAVRHPERHSTDRHPLSNVKPTWAVLQIAGLAQGFCQSLLE
jgi:hypothetical protein